MSSGPRFSIYRDVFGGWRWEYYDGGGEARDARTSFDTREECVEDARAAGLGGTIIALPPQRAPERREAGREQLAGMAMQTKHAA